MAEESRNAAFFAEAFGLTERHVRQLVTEGILLKAGRGSYPLVANIRQYTEELRRQVEGSQEFTDLRKEQARKARAQAEMLEMELAIQRKEHVHISVMRDLLARFAGEASAIFLSAPSKIKNRLPHLKSRDINIIKKELAGISNAIAEIRPHRG